MLKNFPFKKGTKIFSQDFFLNAQEKTVEIVKGLSLRDLGKRNFKRRVYDLHVSLCGVWGVDVGLIVDERNYERLLLTGGSEFDLESLTIKLYLVSLFIYLHEFKHALQFFYPNYRQFKDPEEDAFAWAFTVIKQSFPLYYEILKNSRLFSKNFFEYKF